MSDAYTLGLAKTAIGAARVHAQRRWKYLDASWGRSFAFSELRDAFIAGAAWQAEQDRKLVSATIANPAGEERRKGSRSVE